LKRSNELGICQQLFGGGAYWCTAGLLTFNQTTKIEENSQIMAKAI